MTNEQTRQFVNRTTAKNWEAWETFDKAKRERVKSLMRDGVNIFTAMFVVRTEC